MDDRSYYLKAIEESRKSKEPLPCGAIIVKDGVIIGSGFNRQRELYDITAHAEMLALTEAGQTLKNKNIVGATIYCTCEPCTMCLSAIALAKIGRLVYGHTLESQVGQVDVDISLNDFMAASAHKLEILKIEP